MSRLDRRFAAMRDQALAQPLTRANAVVLPQAELPGGVTIGLSFNL